MKREANRRSVVLVLLGGRRAAWVCEGRGDARRRGRRARAAASACATSHAACSTRSSASPGPRLAR
eukprot:16114202-Heterocapsa_arctica.AAC.1